MKKKIGSALWSGLTMLALLVIAMTFGPALTGFDGNAVNFANALKPPSSTHWMGTDNLGRDVFTRVLLGGRIDLQIVAICVALPFIFGSLVGAVAGYCGGLVDRAILGIVEILWAFPFYVLVIAIVGVLGPSTTTMYIAFTMVSWISYARIVRGEVLVQKRSEYMLAARLLGFSHARIVTRHLLPNVISPAILFALGDSVLTILAVTALSYLGLGVQPPIPEWGIMIADGRNFIFDAWWICTFPGLAIIYVGLSCMLVGEGIDDLLRPKG